MKTVITISYLFIIQMTKWVDEQHGSGSTDTLDSSDTVSSELSTDNIPLKSEDIHDKLRNIQVII